ncbi:hypothetical protein [Hellea balneolensis]|uniref:hypothetical protein n=1 Tax=Hellea balneolensis TaxID=287478 RepID=UPI000685BC80|nr:hypothetical protein [Hellea balneolensis]
MSISTRITLLKVLAFLLLIGPGLLMVTAPVTGLGGLTEMFLDFAYQPYEGAQPITGKSAHLLNAILGGILVGFGAMIWVVSQHVLRKNIALGRRLILIPLICWFITDSLGSVLTGAWFNAVLNAGIFGSFLIALYAGKVAE